MKKEMQKNNVKKWVVFKIEEKRYAVPLEAVERIVQMVEITPVTESPSSFLGVINVQGQIVPVIDLKKRFHLPEREPDLNDKLILAHTPRGEVALPVQEVIGLMQHEEGEWIAAEKLFSNAEQLKGIFKSNGEMIFVLDLVKVLSIEESKRWGGAAKVA